MADARFPERWLTDRRVLRISPEAFRTMVLGLAFSVSNRTDGVLERVDLPLFGARPEVAAELVAADLWTVTASGWLILDYATTQTSRAEFEVLENLRRRERSKKQRQRLEKETSPGTSPGTALKSERVPGDNPRDVSPGQHRQGKSKARQGQDVGASQPGNASWPPVAVRGGCSVCHQPLVSVDGAKTHPTCDPLEAIA